eukprot:m.239584 g.239584  ORF g.239584 m.239584 type:complete len:159 (-) comp13940_c0_seq1:1338-1814(-)
MVKEEKEEEATTPTKDARKAPLISRLCKFPFVGELVVAMGDSPHSNDFPMSQFEEEGIPFVSCSKTFENVPSHLQKHHVGKMEHGTSCFLEGLMEELVEITNSTNCCTKDTTSGRKSSQEQLSAPTKHLVPTVIASISETKHVKETHNNVGGMGCKAK